MKINNVNENTITNSKRPCINCKVSFNSSGKFSKYCHSCSENMKKESDNNKKLNYQLSLKICDNCRKKFMVGKLFSKLCESCNINQEATHKSNNFYTKSNNTLDEYRIKANTGVRWGREFIYLKSNEPIPILLMQGKFHLIKRDGKLNCVGNRVPSRPYVVQKYENLLTVEQIKTLKSLISI